MNLFNFNSGQFLFVLMASLLFVPLIFGIKKLNRNGSEIVWAIPLVCSLVFVIIDFSGRLIMGGNIRYLGTFALALLVLVQEQRAGIATISNPTFVLALMLTICAVLGCFYGRIYKDVTTGAFPIAIPMLILLLKFPVPNPRISLESGAKLISFCSAIITTECCLVRLEILPWNAIFVFSHEKTFCITLGLLVALAIRSRILVLLNLVLIAILFFLYPAATLPIGIISSLAFFLNVGSSSKVRSQKLLIFALTVSVWISIFKSSSLFYLLDFYFKLVDKANNSAYRFAIISAAREQMEKNLFVGNMFTESAAVWAKVLGGKTYQLPVHNDYFTLVLCGGILTLTLFLFIVFRIILKVLAISENLPEIDCRIVRAMLGSVVALLATALANPILINPANSTIFYSLLITAVAICCRDRSIVSTRLN